MTKNNIATTTKVDPPSLALSASKNKDNNKFSLSKEKVGTDKNIDPYQYL